MDPFFRIRSYLHYYLDAIDQYSLHSPSVYTLYNEVFLHDIKEPKHRNIEEVRKRLYADNTTIQVKDFGTGVETERKISNIAKSSLTRQKYNRLLYRLIRYLDSKTILELGTSLGINTAYLAEGSTKVYSIEGCPNISSVAKNTLHQLGLTNVELIEGNIDEKLKTVLDNLGKLDLCFIDANHSSQAIDNYYRLLKKKAGSDTVLVFDDIYWSRDMYEGWKRIMHDPAVTISIDLYQFGIVMFQPEIAKQHFTLWY